MSQLALFGAPAPVAAGRVLGPSFELIDGRYMRSAKRSSPDEFDVLPLTLWGEPAGRMCTCCLLGMRPIARGCPIADTVPSQVHVVWYCEATGWTERWTYLYDSRPEPR